MCALLIADVIVALAGQRGGGLAIPQHIGAQEYHQIGLVAIARLIFEKITDEGNIAQQRNFAVVIFGVVRDQAADHHCLAVINQHGIFD